MRTFFALGYLQFGNAGFLDEIDQFLSLRRSIFSSPNDSRRPMGARTYSDARRLRQNSSAAM